MENVHANNKSTQKIYQDPPFLLPSIRTLEIGIAWLLKGVF